MKELLEAGVHFGHQVRRWNPKMKEYIFGERNGIYIIDLQKTQKLFRDALNFVQESVSERPNQKILFVGTKRQAQDAIKEEAERCGQFYVNHRWLGGLLTNYDTVKKSINKLKEIEAMREDGRFEMLTKKERLKLDREHEGLMRNLAGIKEMNGKPDLMFVIDVRKEDIAIKEANRLGIPIVAVVDTNCSPEGVDHVIPGNDDALRAIRLFASRIADAILEGQQVATEGSSADTGSVETADNEAAVAGEVIAPPADSSKELEISVADKTWETAAETHTIPPATGPEGQLGPVVAGATGEQGKDTGVKSEIEAAASEDITKADEATEPEASAKESSEASAS